MILKKPVFLLALLLVAALNVASAGKKVDMTCGFIPAGGLPAKQPTDYIGESSALFTAQKQCAAVGQTDAAILYGKQYSNCKDKQKTCHDHYVALGAKWCGFSSAVQHNPTPTVTEQVNALSGAMSHCLGVITTPVFPFVDNIQACQRVLHGTGSSGDKSTCDRSYNALGYANYPSSTVANPYPGTAVVTPPPVTPVEPPPVTPPPVEPPPVTPPPTTPAPVEPPPASPPPGATCCYIPTDPNATYPQMQSAVKTAYQKCGSAAYGSVFLRQALQACSLAGANQTCVDAYKAMGNTSHKCP